MDYDSVFIGQFTGKRRAYGVATKVQTWELQAD